MSWVTLDLKQAEPWVPNGQFHLLLLLHVIIWYQQVVDPSDTRLGLLKQGSSLVDEKNDWKEKSH